MEHIADLIDALAWPVAAIWLGYLFRAEVRQLLSRVSQVKYKELEAKFDEGLAAAEAHVQEVPKAHAQMAPPDETLSQLDQLRRIADVSPRAAILEAWMLIESAAMDVGLATGVVTQRVTPRSIIDVLARSEHIPESNLALISRLRQLRNQAAHLPDFALTGEEAERYLELAVRSAEALRALRVEVDD